MENNSDMHLWIILLEKNNRIFEGTMECIPHVRFICIENLDCWSKINVSFDICRYPGIYGLLAGVE